MIRKYVLPLLAILGVGIAIVMVILGNRTAPAQNGVPPASAPFASYIYGSGIVEASTENIAIGTPVSGVVRAVYVKWGDRVKTRKPLIQGRCPRSGSPTPSGEGESEGGRSPVIPGDS